MSDSSNSYSSSSDDEVELEDNQIDKKQKKAVAYYVVDPEYYIKCKCCENLERTDPEPMPDVDDYLTPRQLREFEDKEARKHIARYRKKMRESGGFDVDCPPSVGGDRIGNIFNEAHFVGYPDYKLMLDESTKSAIKEYNEKTGKEMKLLEIRNVTVSQGGCNILFFLTLRCSVIEKGTTSNVSIESSDPVDKGATSNVSIESSDPVEKGTTSNVDVYEAVVSYRSLNKTSYVLVFRRQSDGEDMFKPRCELYAKLTRYPNRKACSGTIPDAVPEGLEK
ncbi:hypothetical protein LINPERHAP2_LOCUS10019 [Linum perenne]